MNWTLILLLFSFIVIGSSLTVLTGTVAFNDFIIRHQFNLIIFRSPNCRQCDKLVAEFKSVAQQNTKTSLGFGIVDGTSELISKYHIHGFPTVLLFLGNGIQPIEYKGAATVQDFSIWLESHTSPLLNEIKFESDGVQLAHKNGLPNFIGTFTSSDSSDFKLFESIITNHRTVGRFWVIINPKTEKSSVVVHRPDEPETSTISWSLGQLSLEELESFIRTECLSWFGTFDSINHSLYTESNKDLLWLIGTRNDRNRLFQILQNIGKRLRSELRPVWIDVTQFKQKSAEFLSGIPPPALVYHPQNRSGNFILKENISEDSILSFINSVQLGHILRTLHSELPPHPSVESPSVKTVVGSTFGDLIINQTDDVLLALMSPLCGHCKRLDLVLTQLAKQTAKCDHLIIAKIDATKNEIPFAGFEPNGFPTLLFLPGGRRFPLAFSGIRTSDNILQFIKRHAVHPVIFNDQIEKSIDDEL